MHAAPARSPTRTMFRSPAAARHRPSARSPLASRPALARAFRDDVGQRGRPGHVGRRIGGGRQQRRRALEPMRDAAAGRERVLAAKYDAHALVPREPLETKQRAVRGEPGDRRGPLSATDGRDRRTKNASCRRPWRGRRGREPRHGARTRRWRGNGCRKEPCRAARVARTVGGERSPRCHWQRGSGQADLQELSATRHHRPDRATHRLPVSYAARLRGIDLRSTHGAARAAATLRRA